MTVELSPIAWPTASFLSAMWAWLGASRQLFFMSLLAPIAFGSQTLIDDETTKNWNRLSALDMGFPALCVGWCRIICQGWNLCKKGTFFFFAIPFPKTRKQRKLSYYFLLKSSVPYKFILFIPLFNLTTDLIRGWYDDTYFWNSMMIPRNFTFIQTVDPSNPLVSSPTTKFIAIVFSVFQTSDQTTYSLSLSTKIFRFPFSLARQNQSRWKIHC